MEISKPCGTFLYFLSHLSYGAIPDKGGRDLRRRQRLNLYGVAVMVNLFDYQSPNSLPFRYFLLSEQRGPHAHHSHKAQEKFAVLGPQCKAARNYFIADAGIVIF